MSFAAAQDSKEQVRQAIDIVDLLGGYIELRRQGRIYVGHCPWHDDRKPSLQVNPERQSWKCWVCDIGGDIFSFVMKREGVEFREALSMLAERAGVQLEPSGARASAQPGSAADKNTLYQAMAWAEQQFHACLLQAPEAEPARRYLQDRGITQESIVRHHLGFAPNQWQWIQDRARSTSFSPSVLQAVGLVGRSERGNTLYDRFKGRVLFSIRDVQRRPIALGGRILPAFADEKAAKYINSPETRLFSKSEQLYGLDLARDTVSKSRHVSVMEGYTDVVMARQYGLDDVVAVLGTALGVRHVNLLRRFADTITLVLDGDEAGQRRASEVLELFVASQVNLRIVTLPQGLDPCDYLQQHGADAFGKLVDSGVDALEYKIRSRTKNVDLANDTHRANLALEEILSVIAKAPRLHSGTTPELRIREDQCLARLARDFRVDEKQLRSRMTALRLKTSYSAQPTPDHTEAPADLDSYERELLEVLVQQPDAVALIVEQITIEEVTSPEARTLYSVFCRLARQGIEADFQRVMSELEDTKLKSLLVKLDENSREKSGPEPEYRVRDIIDAFERRRAERQCRDQAAVLDKSGIAEQEELSLLQQLYDKQGEQQRKRQGPSAPTDG